MNDESVCQNWFAIDEVTVPWSRAMISPSMPTLAISTKPACLKRLGFFVTLSSPISSGPNHLVKAMC